uniref:Uncharacterized protein n=1 Tax=Oryzias latipes TaxID=8090 RepID=A0A3P9I413_ORYLA
GDPFGRRRTHPYEGSLLFKREKNKKFVGTFLVKKKLHVNINVSCNHLLKSKGLMGLEPKILMEWDHAGLQKKQLPDYFDVILSKR